MIVLIRVSEAITEAGSIRNTDNAGFAFSSVPPPLATAYRHVERIAAEKGCEAGLYSLGFQFIPVAFQYCALLFASDYLNGPLPPDRSLSELLENMVIRPTVGKWHEFSRAYSKRLTDSRPHTLLSSLATQYLEADAVKGRWRVSVVENDIDDTPQRYSLLRFMMLLRNRLAHQHGQMNYAEAVFTEAWKAVGAFFRALPDLGALQLNHSEEGEICLEKGGAVCCLYPMMVRPGHDAFPEARSDFLLDEVDTRKLCYTDLKHALVQREREHAPFRDVERLLASVRIDWPLIEPHKLSADEWKKRIRAVGERTLHSIVPGVLDGVSLLAPQFDPEVYVVPEEWQAVSDSFMASDASVLLLSAPQGSGKSAFLGHMQDRAAESDSHEAFLLIDARRFAENLFPTRIIERYLKDKLRIDGDIRNVIASMYEKYGIVTCLLIDGINEFFVSYGKNSTGSPRILLQGLLTFAAEVFAASPEALKMVIAGREEFLEDLSVRRGVIGPVLENYPTGLMYTRQEADSLGVIHVLPGLSDKELHRLYSTIREKLPTHSPSTPWEDLSANVRKLIRNPLRMRLLMHLYSGRHIPVQETEYTLRTGIAKRIVEQTEARACIMKIIESLKKTPYLSLSDIEPDKNKELYRLVIDRTDDEVTGFPKNQAYQQLVDQGVLREEIWVEGDKRTSRVTPFNELLFQVVEHDFRNVVSPFLKRFDVLVMLGFAAAGFSVIGAYVYLAFNGLTESLMTMEILQAEELIHMDTFFSVWSILFRADIVSYAVFGVILVLGTVVAMTFYNLLNRFSWYLRSRFQVSDVLVHKRVTEFTDRNIRFVVPVFSAYGIGIWFPVVVFLASAGIVTMQPIWVVVLVLGLLVPGILLIYVRLYVFCRRQDPTRGARDALFGRRERILTAFVAAKVFVAVGIIVAGVYISFSAALWSIDHVTGPYAENSIEQMVSHLPVIDTQQETEEMELQFLEAERGLAGLEPLRAEAARIVLGERPAVREVLTVEFLSQSNKRWFREIVAAFVTAGVTLIAGLLLVSLLLEPFLYWKLERDARLSNKKLIKRL